MTTDSLMTTAPIADTAVVDTAASQEATATGAPATAAVVDGDQQAADQSEAKDGAAEEADKPAGAPEKYTDFAAPEGAHLDSKVMEQFAEAARDLNLPQDAAQKMIDKMAPIMAARQAEQIDALRTEWAETSKTDKDFGGAKLTENLVHAHRALETLGTPELKGLLNETGLGNHPEFIRLMVKAGKAISEDHVVTGGAASEPATDMASRMYPKKHVPN